MSLGVHVYHRQCIIRQQSCQAERPLVTVCPVFVRSDIYNVKCSHLFLMTMASEHNTIMCILDLL